MKNSYLKALTSGVAALLFMSGITNQALAAATAKPVITSPSSKSCVVGTVCTYTITATNSPTSYSATGLQSWQSRSTNVITGTPTTAGTFSITVSATNAGGTGSLVVAFTINPPPARVVVAPSGGDYTTISAAMAAINPTATNPVVVEVWPGVYTENVVLKDHVHLKGSGRTVTTIQKPTTGANIISATNLTNVAVSGFTINGTNNNQGIYLDNTTATITDNTISNNGGGIAVQYGSVAIVTGNNIISNKWEGVWVQNTNAALTKATLTLTGNLISGNGNGGYNDSTGVYCSTSSTATIKNNVITGNNGNGVEIWNGASPTISDNIITGNNFYGVKGDGSEGNFTITNNKIVNNGGALYPDISTIPTNNIYPLRPNISFNVFDDIVGDHGVGSYNVNSNGDPILVP